MSEQVLSQVKPVHLRYRMQTDTGLSAEEAELYLLAAVDEVSLACLLVQVANAHYDNPLQEAPHSPEDFAQYRRFIRVLSISYRNPWEIIFEVVGTVGAVTAAIATLYNLRTSRRKAEIETDKLRAEISKIEAETRKLNSELESTAVPKLRDNLASYETYQRQLDLATMLISRDRQDRRTRELLAEVVLRGTHESRLDDLDKGLVLMRRLLDSSLYSVMDEAKGPDASLNFEDQQKLASMIADNTRLLASIWRLDDVERSAEALDGDVEEKRSS